MPFWLKAILTIVGTILVGSVGSGVWELAIKPLLPYLLNAALTVVTFGARSVIDSLYADVARGNYDRNAMAVLSIVVALPVGISVGAFIALITSDPITSKTTDRTPSARESAARKIPRTLRILSVGLLLFIVLMASTYLQSVYVTRAAVYIAQLIAVVSPDVDAHQIDIFRSRAASINSRDDYIALTDDLKRLAIQNGHVPPSFSVF